MQASPFGKAAPGSLAARFCGRVIRLAQQARESVSAWQERRALAAELARLDERELADVGLVRGQIPQFVKAYPTAERLLAEMIARLGLEYDERLKSHLMHDDVYRTCVMCRERGRCRRWLEDATTGAAVPSFCPNAWTFRQLLQAGRGQSESATSSRPLN